MNEDPFKTRLPWLGWFDFGALALICAYALIRLAPGLGHASIWNWDEAFHQVVTHSVLQHPFRPTLYDDPLHPLVDLRMWWGFNVWLHKPPAPFWFGALMMRFTGVTPLALRLGSLLGETAMACCIYYLGFALTRRWAAFAAAIAFLSLPFGWIMTQGRYIGDVTDITLAAFICLAVVTLVRSIENDSWKWALVSGAATGVAYLCKTFLSLTPLGIAGVMFGLSLFGFCRGPRLKSLLAMFAGTVAVAGPWNLYAYVTWPDLYKRVLVNTLGFVNDPLKEDLANSIRPVDAIFNEINPHNYEPMGAALIALAGVWLLYKSIRDRSPLAIAVSIWLWSTWIGHSLMAVKGHGHLWNSLVPGFIAVAMVLADAFKSFPLALATLAAVFSPQLMRWLPMVSSLRPLLPAKLDESRRIAGLVEGLVFIAVATVIGLVLAKLDKKNRPLPHLLVGGAASLALLWLVVPQAVALQSTTRDKAFEEDNIAYSREAGRALDERAPAKSLVLVDIDADPKDQFENLNMMFWSGRLSQRGRDPKDYAQNGYQVYLTSAQAEPFAQLDGVPAHSWLRAYDLSQPLSAPPPLPAGVTPLEIGVGAARVLGYAAGDNDSAHGRYAFFVQPNGAPPTLVVTFQTRQGPVVKTIAPEASLLQRGRLANAAWYIAPTLGPPRDQVEEIGFGPGPQVRVAFHGGS